MADSDGEFRDGLTGQLLESALTQELRIRSGLLAGTDGGVAGPSQWLGTGECDRSEPKGKDPWTAWQIKVSVLVDHCAPGERSFAVTAATLLYEVQRYEEAVDRWTSPTPTSWGLTEPALIPWSSAAVTEHLAHSPDKPLIFVGEPGYPTAGVVRIEQTTTGRRERIEAVLSTRG